MAEGRDDADPAHARDDEHETEHEWERFLSAGEMREVALGIARRLLEWEGHAAPPAWTRKAVVTEPLVEREDALDPVWVNEERYEAEPPRARVALGMWRLAAEVTVEHQAASGELLAWRNRSEALKKGPKAIDKARAVEIAEALVGDLPRGAEGPMADEIGDAADERAFQVSWAHFAPENVLVDGDLLLVRVNAATGQPYTLFRKWRVVPDERSADDGGDATSPAAAAPAAAERG